MNLKCIEINSFELAEYSRTSIYAPLFSAISAYSAVFFPNVSPFLNKDNVKYSLI